VALTWAGFNVLLEELELQELNQILAYLSDTFTRMNDLSLSLKRQKYKHIE